MLFLGSVVYYMQETSGCCMAADSKWQFQNICEIQNEHFQSEKLNITN